jgi:hypothetical protein
MARSPAEIQDDIALTRRVIERRLDAVQRRIPRRWWTGPAVLAGGLVLGAVLSRVPFLRLVGSAARVLRTGVVVAGAVAAADRFLAEQRERRAA